MGYAHKVYLTGGFDSLQVVDVNFWSDTPDQTFAAISVIQNDQSSYWSSYWSGSGHQLSAVGSSVMRTNVLGQSTQFQSGLPFNDGYRNDNYKHLFSYRNISGLAQLDFGNDVIISDTGNRCLRKLDTRNYNNTPYSYYKVSLYAGECNGNDTGSIVSISNLHSIRFCSPTTLQYLENTENILVLDTCDSKSVIYSIDLNSTEIVILYNADYAISGFKFTDSNTLTLLPHSDVGGGVIEVDVNKGHDKSIAGCALKSMGRACSPTSLNTNLRILAPQGIDISKGVYIVSDRASNNVYLFDTLNDEFFGIREHITPSAWSQGEPVAVALFDGYLYIGGSVKAGDPFLIMNRVRMFIADNYTYPRFPTTYIW